MRKKVDANQKQIVRDLERAGVLVFVTSDLGFGFPDLVAGDRRTKRVYLFEVKNPERRWTLTPAERRFHSRWVGLVHVVETAQDALRVMGMLS